MPLALVTGATGLVGSHIVERLRADGWRVRALVRDPRRDAWVESLGAELVPGDVLDVASVAYGARDAQAIFHTSAAIFPTGGWEGYRRPNVEGTRNVIAATEKTGARLLHLSSVAVYGPSRYRGDGQRTDETTTLTPLPDDAWYARSKRESEALVMAAQRAGRIWATAIRPCVVYGRRDRQFVPRTARLFRHGVAPSLRHGRAVFSIVHAANVADAAVRAAACEVANGQAYNTANDYAVTVRDFVRLAGAGLGRRIRQVPIPLALASGAATLATMIARASGRAGSFSPSASVHFLSRDNPFNSDLARRDFGWDPPVHPDAGVPEAFRWWKENGRASSAPA